MVGRTSRCGHRGARARVRGPRGCRPRRGRGAGRGRARVPGIPPPLGCHRRRLGGAGVSAARRAPGLAVARRPRRIPGPPGAHGRTDRGWPRASRPGDGPGPPAWQRRRALHDDELQGHGRGHGGTLAERRCPDRRGRRGRVIGSARPSRRERHLLQHDRSVSEPWRPPARRTVDRAGRALDAAGVGRGLSRHMPGASRGAQDAPRRVAGSGAGGAPGVHRARAIRAHGRRRVRAIPGGRDPVADGRPRRAAEAFDRAYEFGHDAMPGLALLHLARGDVAEAQRADRRGR